MTETKPLYNPPTVVGIFMHQARRFGDKKLSMAKKGGAWETKTWRQALESLPSGVMGLFALGFEKGDTVGIAGRTRVEWSEADMTILAAGGVTVGLYPSASLWEMTHVVSHSGLQICFVEDEALLDKLLAVRAKTGLPKKMVLFDPMTKPLPPDVITLETFINCGRQAYNADPARFENIWRDVRPSDTATIAYTSGTTGPPKGAVITHANLYHTVMNATKMHHYEESDFGMAFLPLTHMLQRMTVYAAMHLGIMGAYAESIDKLVENFQELRPTVQVSVPQIFDRIYNRVRQMLDSGSPLKRRIFQWAVDVGRKTAPYRHQNQSLPFFQALKHAVAHRLVFSKIHNVFGDRRKYLTALITLNESELKIFAGRENLAQIEPAALTNHQKVRQAVSEHVQAVNSRLAPYEQIKRFTILPRDFSEEAGELTPTLKIRRREIIKRYGDKIESLYGE